MSRERILVEITVDDEAAPPPVTVETGLDTAATDHLHRRGVLLILAAVFCFAIMDATAKYLNRHYPAPGLVWARYLVHLIMMLVLFGRRMGLDLVRSANPGWQMVRGVLLMTSTLCAFLALKYLPLAETCAIGFVSPLLVTILSSTLLKEEVSRERWAAVATGFFGVLIIVRPGGGLLTAASMLPLGAACCFSTYQIITRKIAHADSPYVTLFYVALVGSVLMTFALPFAWKTPTPGDAVLVVATGLLGGSAHFFMIRALTHAPAALLAPFVYSQLLWATIFGLLFFGEFPDGWSVIGMMFIVGSGLYVAYGQKFHLHRPVAGR